MPTKRQMPATSFRHGALIVAAFVLAVIGLLWLSMQYSLLWLGGVVLVLPAFFGAVFFRSRRCPTCGQRLAMRKERLPDDASRVWLDCLRCDIAWDTGHINRLIQD